MKTEVYSWRVSTDIKTGLEREARRRKLSLAAVLDLAADEWLKKRLPGPTTKGATPASAAAMKCFGSVAGGDPLRSENAARAVRERLRRQYGR